MSDEAKSSRYHVELDDLDNIITAVWLSGPNETFISSDTLRYPHFLTLVELARKFTDGPVGVTPDWGIVIYDSVLGRRQLSIDHLERMETRLRMLGPRGLARR